MILSARAGSKYSRKCHKLPSRSHKPPQRLKMRMLRIADNPEATTEERRRAGQIFSDMEGNELFNKMIGSNPERAKKITGLMDEISGKTISGEGKAVGNVVRPQNISEVPADISGFDIRDFV